MPRPDVEGPPLTGTGLPFLKNEGRILALAPFCEFVFLQRPISQLHIHRTTTHCVAPHANNHLLELSSPVTAGGSLVHFCGTAKLKQTSISCGTSHAQPPCLYIHI